GLLVVQAQLPAGATQQRTEKVLDQVTDYFLTHEKETVKSVFTVNGFGFAGRGQNTGIAFLSLKPWEERTAAADKVDAI
ncbi:efflux RND transporter permease subunit, partial [Rosenbergiella collisarenosi]